jgi:hypothetical protein
MSNQTNQHYHANLIHAWADGAKIQYFSKKRDKWVTVTNPSWDADKQYRKKVVLEDWQKDFIDAIKDGKEIEYCFMGTWVPAHINDIVDDHDEVAGYTWATQDHYRIKPAQTIKVHGITLHGLTVDADGETQPYIHTNLDHQFSCQPGDELMLKLTISE